LLSFVLLGVSLVVIFGLPVLSERTGTLVARGASA
jgi:hypothetical protein